MIQNNLPELLTYLHLFLSSFIAFSNTVEIVWQSGDLLEAIVNLQKQQEELLRAHQKELSKKHTQVLKNVEVSLKKFDQQQSMGHTQ